MSELSMLYGASGSSKTTTCGFFHEHEFKRTGQVGYHVTIDSSVEPLQDQIDAGMVKVWHLGYERPEIQSSLGAALTRLANGWVPKDLAPTGQRVSHEWIQPKCSLSVEGLFMLANAYVQYLVKDRGMSNAAFVELDGSNVGGAQMQAYSIVKDTMTNVLTRMKGLSNVDRILWTSHEGTGQDSMQCTVLGPAAVPNKGLDKWPALFAHCLRVQSIDLTNEAGQIEKAKLYHFDSHKDEKSGLVWPAKASLSIQKIHLLRQHAAATSNGSTAGALIARITQEGQVQGGFVNFLKFLDWTRLKAQETGK